MNIIKRAVNWSLRKVGLELRRAAHGGHDSGDRLVDFLGMLRVMGFTPKTIYDIGANRGAWSAKVLRVFPDSKYVLFEPQAHLKGEITKATGNRPNITLRQAAVSDAIGTAEFAEFEWDVCSRLSSEMDPAWDVKTKKVTVETTTVDQEVGRAGGMVPDLLKIDAEGHDFRVLDGARSALGKTPVVLVEAAVCCPSMENTVRRVVDRMWDEGYSLAGIVDLNEFHVPGKQISGVLWLIDLAFCLTDGPLIAKLQDPAVETDGTKSAEAKPVKAVA
jgi:FkbM family methyltransferase